MSSIADVSVKIQTSAHAVPSTPSWFGEAVLIVGYLKKLGVLDAIAERVRFARRRFGHYEVIDFVAVLFGYAISGERTLEADRKSTRLNSSHVAISYAVFCLKKKIRSLPIRR